MKENNSPIYLGIPLDLAQQGPIGTHGLLLEKHIWLHNLEEKKDQSRYCLEKNFTYNLNLTYDFTFKYCIVDVLVVL